MHYDLYSGENEIPRQDNHLSPRRNFLRQGLMLVGTSVASAALLEACGDKENEEEGQEVSPPEDLMQEHGLLNRILLIYENCRLHLINKQSFPKESLLKSAEIIRSFVEDYHEKQEEDFLFPRFKKANQLTELVDILLAQHQAGRKITDEIMQLVKVQAPTDAENEKLVQLMTAFVSMYRPHEAREDTILFPAFRKIISRNEYESLGEQFEKNEHKLFGSDGFEGMVNKVEAIEKSLGIYELSQFTPLQT